MELHPVSEGITVPDLGGGELVVESVSGDIDLRRIDAKSVDAQAISGEVIYEGRIVAAGSYSFLTHSGDVTLAIAETTNASISVVTGSGEVTSSFPSKPSGPVAAGTPIGWAPAAPMSKSRPLAATWR